MTSTHTLTDFLLARIAEDEVAATEWYDDPGEECFECSGFSAPRVPDALDYARWVVECDAKRRIVREHSSYGGYGKSCQTCSDSDIDLKPWPCPTLRFLALPYADHPDYRGEWKP